MHQVHDDPNIWITDIDTVQTEELPDVERVISTCQDTAEANVPDDVRYRHVSLADDLQSQANWGGSCSYDQFGEAVLTIRTCIVFSWPTVIHCHHGANRSVATTAAALAVHTGYSLAEALTHICSVRPQADPDPLMLNHASRYVSAQTDGMVEAVTR